MPTLAIVRLFKITQYRNISIASVGDSSLLKHLHYAHPIKEDVKEKILSPPLAGNQGVVTYIQPCLLIRGAFDFSALARRGFQRRGQPQLLVPTHWFHETVALDAIQFRSYASYLLA